jgi:hypothetical protein
MGYCWLKGFTAVVKNWGMRLFYKRLSPIAIYYLLLNGRDFAKRNVPHLIIWQNSGA